MNTADILGDMYFDLRGVSVPLECAHPNAHSAHDCDNPEVIDPNLIIAEVTLTVDNRFGNYGRCNLCVNGTDHHGNNSCTSGDYWCSCGDYTHTAPCGRAVGQQNLSAWMGDRTCDHDPDAQLWDCWKDAVAHKTCVGTGGGFWYSTTSDGFCGNDPANEPAGCTWRLAHVNKRVNKTCSDDKIYSTVEGFGRQCFRQCSGMGPHRNTSEPCWIKCFYNTVVGPEAGHPHGALAGMPIQDLKAAWQSPFRSNNPKLGGCPAI
eukprot:UC1_evm4s1656